MRAIAIDFETANSARASACAVGLAVIEDGVVVDTIYRLIRPRPLSFGYFETRVHGITAADVAAAPEFPDIFQIIRPYLGSHLVLAHNQAFDVGVLKAATELFGLDLPPFEAACTLEMARVIWRGERGHKLSDVAPRLGVDFRHHHAEDDAIMAARIALHAAGLQGTTSVRAAIKRLGVSVRRVDLAAPVTEKPAPKASARRAVADASTDVLEFEVSGSTGNPYRVRSGYHLGAFFVRCGCTAGRNGRICHHVRELAAGEVDNLVSENRGDVREFARRCHSAGGLAFAVGRAGR